MAVDTLQQIWPALGQSPVVTIVAAVIVIIILISILGMCACLGNSPKEGKKKEKDVKLKGKRNIPESQRHSNTSKV